MAERSPSVGSSKNSVPSRKVPPAQAEEEDMSDIPGIRVTSAPIAELEDIIARAKQQQSAILNDEKEDMSDIPGIRVTMASIVEDQNLTEETAQPVSEKNSQNEAVQNIRCAPIVHDLQSAQAVQDAKSLQNVQDVQNIPDEQNVQSVKYVQNVPPAQINNDIQIVQNIQDVQQPMDIDQNISQEQKPEQVANETVPLIEALQQQQSQQLLSPHDQNDAVVHSKQTIQQPMDIDQNMSQEQKPEQVVNKTVPLIEVPQQQQPQQLSSPHDQNDTVVQNIQTIQQPMDINQNVSQEQKPKQFANEIVEGLPAVNETAPLIEAPQQQPHVQNDAVVQSIQNIQQPMDINQNISQEQKPKQFAYEIVEDLPSVNETLPLIEVPQQQQQTQQLLIPIVQNEAVAQNQHSVQQGIKRTHEDSYDSYGSVNTRDEASYNDYGRDSKRVAYDSGFSRPEFNSYRDLQDRNEVSTNVASDSSASPQSNDRPVTLIGEKVPVNTVIENVNTEVSKSDKNQSN